MPYVCLVRHGQSFGNAHKVFSGSSEDHELTPLGVSQAEKAGRQLAGYSFDEIHSSALTRAIATAQIIKMSSIYPPKNWYISAALNERFYGVVSGKNRELVEKQFGKEKTQLWSTTLNGAPPGGQNLFQVYSQVKEYYKKAIEPKLATDNILIVSHMHITRSLMVLLEDLPISQIFEIDTIKNAQPILYEF
jgi:2,3-bisphosphoglycerate-dependent phosphoglycerate mutase